MNARRALFRGLLVASLVGQAACGGGGGASAPVAPGPLPSPTPSPTPTPAPTPTPPTVTAPPGSQAAAAGSPVTFAVTSPDATSHQWQRSSDGGVTWMDVAGASAASLTLPAPALIDNGTRYRVVLGNEAGSTTSESAQLTVHPRLRLLAGALGGPGHLDATGRDARFDFNRGIALDAQGNLVVADSNNHVLRRVTPAGVVSTIAGEAGARGHTDGPAATARLSTPRSVAVDAQGAIWFIDQGTCYLRKLAHDAVTSIARLVGEGYCYLESTRGDPYDYDPAELAIGPGGDVYVSDRERDIISRVDAAGKVTLYAGHPQFAGSDDGPRLAARFRNPRGLAFDAAGNLYVADGNSTIRRIDPAGSVTTIAGVAGQYDNVDGIGASARLVRPLALSVAGDWLVFTDTAAATLRLLHLATFEVRTIAGESNVTGASDGRGSAAHFNGPYGVANDGRVIYVSDGSNHLLRTATFDGQVSTLAGQLAFFGASDGPSAAARFSDTAAIVADAAGNVYAADAANHAIRRITPAGNVSTFAGRMGVTGWVDGGGDSARFSNPTAIAIDGTGNLIIADTGNNAVRKVSPDGNVTTIAGGGPSGAGYADGPGAVARFRNIRSVSVDPADNIFVADADNCAIRKISSAGMVSTPIGAGPTAPLNCLFIDSANISVPLGWPYLVLAIGTDDVLFADVSSQLIRVRADRRVVFGVGSRAGFADGPADKALFGYITALARDAAGNIYVADSGNHALRLIRPDFSVKTLVHNGVNTVPGDNPSLRAPGGIAVLPGNALAISTEGAIVVD